MVQGVARHWTGTAWVDLTQQGPIGPPGPEGPPGPVDPTLGTRIDGVEATIAALGGTVYSGTGTPAPGVGLMGDYFHSTDQKRLYGPKGSDTAWGSPLTLEYIGSRSAANVTSVAVPEGTVAGDLVFVVTSTFSEPTVTPTNFTPVGVAQGQYGPVRMSFKVVNGTDITNGVTGLTTGSYTYHSVHTYRNGTGVRTSTAVDWNSGLQPALPMSGASTRAVYMVSNYSGSAEPPAPFVSRVYYGFGYSNHRLIDRPHTSTSSPNPGYTDQAIVAAVVEPTMAIAYISLADGRIHSGVGTPPPSIGLKGDYWHATDLKRLYGPKGSDTAWGAAATINYRGATARTTDGVLAVPAGTQVGDFLMARGVNFTAAVASLPAGWTLVGEPNSGNYLQKVFTKIATQSDIDNGVTVDIYDSYGIYSMLAYGDVASMRKFEFVTGTGAALTALAPSTDGPTTVAIFTATSSGANEPGIGVTTRSYSTAAATATRIMDAPVPAGGPAPTYTMNNTGNGMAVDTMTLEPVIVSTYVDLDPAFGSRLTDVETRIGTAEGTLLRYAGVYNPNGAYAVNDLVVFEGTIYRNRVAYGGSGLPVPRIHLNGDDLGAVGSTITGWGGYTALGTGTTVVATPGGTKAAAFNGQGSFAFGDLLAGVTSGEVIAMLRKTQVNSSQLWDFGADTTNIEHYPYTDGYVYTDWGSSQRKSFTTTDTAAWHSVDISSALNSWIARQNDVVRATITTNTVAFNGALKLNPGAGFEVAELFVYDYVLTPEQRTAVISKMQRHLVAATGGTTEATPTSTYWDTMGDPALRTRVSALETSGPVAFVPFGTASTIDDEFRDATLGSSYTQVGAGTSTWLEAGDVLSVNHTGTAAAQAQALLVPFSLAIGQSVETAVRIAAVSGGVYAMAGPVITDGTLSTSNAAWTDRYQSLGSASSHYVGMLAGTLDTIPSGGTQIDVITGLIYLRATYVAANTFRASWSLDGITWVQAGADATRAMTPTHIGIAVSTWGAASRMVGSFEYLRVR